MKIVESCFLSSFYLVSRSLFSLIMEFCLIDIWVKKVRFMWILFFLIKINDVSLNVWLICGNVEC